MNTKIAKPVLVLGITLLLVPRAHAQNDQFFRTNPKFVATFRDVVAKPSLSTVRILCDGKETALGMIVGSDGWILTKANDLQGRIACRLKDGREFAATIVGVHKEHDLAMLKIDSHDLVPIEFTPSKVIDAGCWVACAGTKVDPVAIGVVSVTTRNLIVKGAAFTIDRTKAGYLGIQMEKSDGGVLITGIEPKTPADKAGLLKQDLVIAVSGKAVTEIAALAQAIGNRKPGDVVTLRIRRDGEEKEIQATLGRAPANMARGDIQNNMGSELSSRRTGYPTILQHDSVVKPTDCGGPIVDLEGRVIGINICRAGRTESWAVPSEVLQAVMADLKSGKLALAPPPDIKPVVKERKKLTSAADKSKAIDTLLSLMKQRLDISVDVARFKFVNKLAIADFNRERELLGRLLEAAAEDGLDQDLAREFIIAQIAASRELQQQLHARWNKDNKASSAATVPDLEKTLRPKLDKISMDLLEAYADAQPFLTQTPFKQLVRQRAVDVLQGSAISEAIRTRAFDGWLPQ